MNPVSETRGGGQPPENPFVAHRAILVDADDGEGHLLGDLALHLWNGEQWPANLGRLARGADEAHWRIAQAMIAWYRAHGEDDPAFMDLCLELAGRRQGTGFVQDEGLRQEGD